MDMERVKSALSDLSSTETERRKEAERFLAEIENDESVLVQLTTLFNDPNQSVRKLSLACFRDAAKVNEAVLRSGLRNVIAALDNGDASLLGDLKIVINAFLSFANNEELLSLLSTRGTHGACVLRSITLRSTRVCFNESLEPHMHRLLAELMSELKATDNFYLFKGLVGYLTTGSTAHDEGLLISVYNYAHGMRFGGYQETKFITHIVKSTYNSGLLVEHVKSNLRNTYTTVLNFLCSREPRVQIAVVDFLKLIVANEIDLVRPDVQNIFQHFIFANNVFEHFKAAFRHDPLRYITEKFSYYVIDAPYASRTLFTALFEAGLLQEVLNMLLNVVDTYANTQDSRQESSCYAALGLLSACTSLEVPSETLGILLASPIEHIVSQSLFYLYERENEALGDAIIKRIGDSSIIVSVTAVMAFAGLEADPRFAPSIPAIIDKCFELEAQLRLENINESIEILVAKYSEACSEHIPRIISTLATMIVANEDNDAHIQTLTCIASYKPDYDTFEAVLPLLERFLHEDIAIDFFDVLCDVVFETKTVNKRAWELYTKLIQSTCTHYDSIATYIDNCITYGDIEAVTWLARDTLNYCFTLDKIDAYLIAEIFLLRSFFSNGFMATHLGLVEQILATVENKQDEHSAFYNCMMHLSMLKPAYLGITLEKLSNADEILLRVHDLKTKILFFVNCVEKCSPANVPGIVSLFLEAVRHLPQAIKYRNSLIGAGDDCNLDSEDEYENEDENEYLDTPLNSLNIKKYLDYQLDLPSGPLTALSPAELDEVRRILSNGFPAELSCKS